MSALDGAWAKVCRGHEHAEAAQKAILDAPDDVKRVTLFQRFKPDDNTIEVRVGFVPVLPDTWALMIADALQNFRAALNFLAWELAQWNLAQQGATREPSSATQFPIADTVKQLKQAMVRDIHPDHIAIIETFQPYDPDYLAQFPWWWSSSLTYTQSTVIDGHPLIRLRKLTNRDKHRALHLVAMGLSSYSGKGFGVPTDCTIHGVTSYATPGLLKLGAPWATYRITPTGRNPKVNMNQNITLEVAFEQGWSVEEVLTGCEGATASILRCFESVFV